MERGGRTGFRVRARERGGRRQALGNCRDVGGVDQHPGLRRHELGRATHTRGEDRALGREPFEERLAERLEEAGLADNVGRPDPVRHVVVCDASDQADAIAHLEGLPDGGLGGIFAGQVVEHLPPATLFRFLELAAQKLRPGALLIAETINPLSPLALRSYFADLTHAQPLVPETLELLAKQAGFHAIQTRFLNAPRHADDVDERIREILFAPLDYALVART